ncbi:RNA ligase family protein [Nocardia harenae]|uniref:RNA ligase family protein n=1 Tax=Nocardia harenae TaxID=358707 RepID=UPI0008316738|nr:RNA ligase family protein [Nocardia harenae]
MTDFVRFPSTPYLVTPESVDVRDDKVLGEDERAVFLAERLHVEEKVDGQNLGISADVDGLRFQARGSYVHLGGRHFQGLSTWIEPRRRRLTEALGGELILFGEWCAVKHSVGYDSLPDWFLVFDVYDTATGRFWDPDVRNALADDIGLQTVPFLGAGHYTLDELAGLIRQSHVGHEQMEGIVARATASDERQLRAKVVRPDFVQGIDRHWTTEPRTMNRLRVSP